MSTVMIQIRHVPRDVHRRLKARAALQGLSLSDYLLREATRLAEQPTMEEMMERIARRTPVVLRLSSAELVREDRDGR